MKVSGVYRDIQPAGTLAGAPVVTIKFSGCSVGCCSQPIGELYPNVGAEVVMSQIAKLDASTRLIRLAGNEPMKQPGHDLFSLLESITSAYGAVNRSVILETCGTCNLASLRSGLGFDSVSIYLHPRMVHSDRRKANRLESWGMLRSDLGDCILMMCRSERDIEAAVEDLRKVVEGYAAESLVPVYFYLDSEDEGTNAKIAEWFVHFIREFRKLNIDARLGVKITHDSEQFARDRAKLDQPELRRSKGGAGRGR